MSLDYFILVFMAAMGVYQIAAIHAKLDGLCFFKQPVVQYIFGLLAIIGAFGWFFTSKERNYQHTTEGAQQLGLFLGAIVISYFVTAILASIIQAKVNSHIDKASEARPQDTGIDIYRTNTFIGSIASRLKKEKKGKV